MLEKNCIVTKKTAPTDPTQSVLVWFGSDFIFKVNRTKPNRMLFYLGFGRFLPSKPNLTAPRTPLPATHRGKEKFPIPTEYCHQPSIEAREK